MLKLFNPPLFQGSLSRKKYFEGWYFKQVSADLSSVYSFIPGISLSKNDRHAFIQVINGISGETTYIDYPIEQFSFKKNTLDIAIGESRFTEHAIALNIQHEEISVLGQLDYSGHARYPSSLKSPGIMGWYSYVPFMECYHGIVSANHQVQGSLNINQKQVDFDHAKGYIEKDWGRSFPESWIWVQSNSFKTADQSVFLSVAKIPWLGKFFIGFIAFVYREGEFTLFASYNGSKIKRINKNGLSVAVVLESPTHDLELNVRMKNSGELRAPVSGEMKRMIKESIDSELSFKLIDKRSGQKLEDQSPVAGFELIEDIFNYL
jgi:tocopherol cyclase